MSFHPEGMDGWTEGFKCPYCGSDDLEFICEDSIPMSGVSCSYQDSDGVCKKCGKPIRIVEEVVYEVYGCYKPEE